MSLVHSFEVRTESLIKNFCVGSAKHECYCIMDIGLVALERENVIALALDNFFGKFFLAADGVDCYGSTYDIDKF